ncbi:MAG: type II secretion system protein [Pirellulales bacterium]|nr:type II secretion system protein [Pirellulales bacterium]
MPRLQPTTRAARGFTLIEALFTMTLVSVAGAAMLAGLTSAMQMNQAALEMTIAQGIAQQMIDDISARKFHDGDPYQWPFSASSIETSGPGYSRYNDIDDFHGYNDQPVADPWGITLGTDNGLGGTRNANFRVRNGYFDRWRREVRVYYVNENNLVTPLSGSQTSNYRLVHVQVFHVPTSGTKRLLAEVKRVFSNVPSN